jgi:hypothetical protein
MGSSHEVNIVGPNCWLASIFLCKVYSTPTFSMLVIFSASSKIWKQKLLGNLCTKIEFHNGSPGRLWMHNDSLRIIWFLLGYQSPG